MKNLIALIIGILIIAPSFLSINTMAWVYTNTYPYQSASHCGCEADPWGFYKRQCTSYVAWKINESGRSFSNGMVGPNGKSGWFGNAGNWDDNASGIGFLVNHTPLVGSIAVWEANSGGAGTAGHVARVEKVNSNGSVDISEFNWNYGNGLYNERYGRIADKYLHISNGNTCSGTNPVIQNTTINGPFSCSNVGNITILPVTNLRSESGNIILR